MNKITNHKSSGYPPFCGEYLPLLATPVCVAELPQGGCNGGSGKALPPCPTATGHLTGRVVGESASSANCAAIAAANHGEPSPIPKLRLTRQIRLLLPASFASSLAETAPRNRGELLYSVVVHRLGAETDFKELISSADQVGKLAVLLAQARKYSQLEGMLRSKCEEFDAAFRFIRRLYPNIGAACVLSAFKGNHRPSSQASESIRVSVPTSLADRLLALPPQQRKRFFWLVCSAEAVDAVHLPDLVRNMEFVREAGIQLNKALRAAGKGNGSELVSPSANEALTVLSRVFRKSLKGGDS